MKYEVGDTVTVKELLKKDFLFIDGEFELLQKYLTGEEGVVVRLNKGGNNLERKSYSVRFRPITLLEGDSLQTANRFALSILTKIFRSLLPQKTLIFRWEMNGKVLTVENDIVMIVLIK